MSDAPQTPRSEAPPSQGAPTKIGSYRLVEPLGSGGMSSVFRAVHEGSGQEVALKILPRSLARNPTLLQRFLREAHSVAALQHPSIVEIFDRGAEDGRHYIVLELVSGGDLHDRVRNRGPLPVREALAAIKAAARGLEYAAEKGVIHRDIKPANLLLTLDGQVKITDLGLALKAGDEDERVTRDGTTVGTVDFMSPEQARDSRATSVRSDIYSLGCTFYYLLTGQAPFPGGTLPEKLRRHAHDAPPDVREIRPDVPEPLAELIRRMMSKKPERRFLDYEHLLDALEELPISPPVSPPTALIDDESAVEVSAPVLTALIDEEDEDEDEVPAVGPVLTALIDEDDDEEAEQEQDESSGGFTLGPPQGLAAEPPSTRSHAVIPTPGAPPVNLSALAGVERESEAIRRPPGPVVAPEWPSRPAAEPPRQAPRPGAEPIAPLDPVDAEIGMAGPVTLPKQPPPDRTLIVLTLRGVLAGLLLAFLGIGIYNLYGVVVNRPRPGPVEPGGTAQPAVSDQAKGGTTEGGAEPTALATRPPWHEPGEPEPEAVRPEAYPEALVEALGLAGVRSEPAPEPPTRPAIVERRAAVNDRERVDSLALAFDLRSEVVEIDDDGPFFESDLRSHRSARTVRASAGRRPMVVLVAPRSPAVRARPAMAEVTGAALTFEGIDFVVRATDLPATHAALFLLRDGASLTLRDCTLTVEGVADRTTPFAAVQVGLSGTAEPKASTVRLERTLIRGDALAAVRLAEGSAEVVVGDSTLISGDAPALAVSGAGLDRSVKLLGSTLVSAGPALELAGSAAGSRAKPVVVRALGTMFAHVEGGTRAGSGLVALREPPGGGPSGSPVDWRGDRNEFDGWPGTPGGVARPALADLDALRSAHPGTDEASTSRPEAWPASSGTAWALPTDLATASARPTPNLRGWTLGSFKALPPETPGSEGSPEGTPEPQAQRLAFEADAGEWSGDLGRFLAAKLKPGASRVVVEARGTGWHPFTPIRMPEGVGLEIVVEPPASGRAEDRLIWRPRDEARAEALIDVRGADLRIEGAVFERDARNLLGRVVRVEGGRLRLERCLLTAPMDVETDGGGLVEFRTEGTRPVEGSDGWPVCGLVDCVLITGGDALAADVGRGVVGLSGCAIAAGTSALTLRPQGVARDRFAADLRLERCTLTALGSIVRLGGWSGAASGPDRPWLVASQGCVFLDRFDRGRSSTSVLLRAEPRALAAGSLVWQSESDGYDLSRFVLVGDEAAGPRSFDDVGSRWVEFWGASHIRGAIDVQGTLELAGGRLNPKTIAPRDLALRISAQGPPLGADLGWLGLSAGEGGRGPGRSTR